MADVIGAIREKWLGLGGEGFFGRATDVERPTFDGVGRAQGFSGGGIISWHPSVGAFGVWGQICAKWEALGRERYGYPVTDELPVQGRARALQPLPVDAPGRPARSLHLLVAGDRCARSAGRHSGSLVSPRRGTRPVGLPHERRIRHGSWRRETQHVYRGLHPLDSCAWRTRTRFADHRPWYGAERGGA